MDDDIVDDADLADLDSGSRPSAGPSRPSITSNGSSSRAVQQPKPQALPSKSASVILVSPRQKGNPALNHIRSVGWEYSDIPADFVLGSTTCALFLSLKYHRLHPEYIYTRIKALGGRYNLRIVLTLVDIDNHEDPLKELSKTSLINNVTVILSWSSQEAGRYLELYKNYEHAAPTSIKGIQSTTYSDQLVDFVTVPRGINKTDAVSLVATFGSIKTAINARPEEIALISGWGEKKVQRWCKTVREPFRTKKAKQRGFGREVSGLTPSLSRNATRDGATPALSRGNTTAEREVAARLGIGEELPNVTEPVETAGATTSDADRRPQTRIAEDVPTWEPGADEEEAMAEMSDQVVRKPKERTSTVSSKKRPADETLEDGVAAALSKLRRS
ncbi:Asparagine synthetase domain-containing protein [Sphaceloma murrayae]|uniref:Asparagine synthetase domain-containing protein n=1 Tax=Sphaceloma murrayae TaxID=2082308 RepID=A0A2K1QXL7_9PEZI|nr:Asparagine synthetase domain-containing protein [Sphaceloma murrayae]